MFPSSGGRRLIDLIRRAAAGGTNHLQPQLHAARLPYRYYSSAPLARTTDPDTAAYLVTSCGLSPADAAAASRRVRIRSTDKADAVLALLRRHGYSDAHIARTIRGNAILLCLDPDRIIRPKLEFFAALGVRADALSWSNMLLRSLEKGIAPFVEFLRGVLGSDANIRTAVTRSPFLLRYDHDHETRMRSVLEALRRHGLSENAIPRFLTINPVTLMMTPCYIGEICKELEALGLPITDSRFAYGFQAMSKLKRETWLQRVALYQSFGVCNSQLLEAFKKQPTIMMLSNENIKKKLWFFLDELKLELSDVMRQPKLIACSLEKNILRRCAVLSVLMREGKIERDIDLLRPLLINSKHFSDKFVLQYADNVPDVVKAYEGKIIFKGFED
ncbi:unnamed protein product [Urochloa humidicola]